jgi:hypothetical protein
VDRVEDGTRAVQTRGARRGEPRILCCVQTERPPLEGPTDAKTGGPALGSVDAVLLLLLAVE